MLHLRKKSVSSGCPKTGKCSGHKRKGRWLIWIFPLAGIVDMEDLALFTDFWTR
jgi:hypothetical protein